MPDVQPLELRQRAVGPWPMNSYVLVCPETRQSVLIDPGAEPEILTAMLADTLPVAILLTHSHGDHIGELETMRLRLQVPVYGSAGPYVVGARLSIDRTLANGAQVALGSQVLSVYETPGHTDDMLCYATPDWRVIVGDTIFAGGPGHTWTTEGFATTLVSLRQVILRWPDTAVCYPGHGPSFRLADLRAAITTFVAKDHGAFCGDATWDQ